MFWLRFVFSDSSLTLGMDPSASSSLSQRRRETGESLGEKVQESLESEKVVNLGCDCQFMLISILKKKKSPALNCSLPEHKRLL